MTARIFRMTRHFAGAVAFAVLLSAPMAAMAAADGQRQLAGFWFWDFFNRVHTHSRVCGHIGTRNGVPELDASVAGAAIALTAGGMLVAGSRRKRRI